MKEYFTVCVCITYEQTFLLKSKFQQLNGAVHRLWVTAVGSLVGLLYPHSCLSCIKGGGQGLFLRLDGLFYV